MTSSQFFSRDKEREGLVFVTRLPKRSAHLFDRISGGKKVLPGLWFHSSVDRGTFIFTVSVLMRYRCHLHTAGRPIQEL
jgi:hypothetical protein